MDQVDEILQKLADHIASGTFEELESDIVEIKPVPPTGSAWNKIRESVNAFLNTRGGFLILGVKEESRPVRKYVYSGWDPSNESNLRNLASAFTDRAGNSVDLKAFFPPPEVRELPRGLGRVCIVYIDPLPADERYVFFEGVAYRRYLTQDVMRNDAEIDAQEEFRQEARRSRELQLAPGVTLASLDLEKLNRFIYQLNQPVLVETIKPDIESARPFLERKSFTKDGAVTLLGALVCASYPGDHLGFRCHLHAYVDVSSRLPALARDEHVVEDKQDFVDNVLQLMEAGYGYLLRNIHVGVSVKSAGSSQPQYPAPLLRETINNALAHRDYSKDRQIIVTVMPGKHIAIENPGSFPPRLLREAAEGAFPLFRIIPEAKPSNPKLADVLRVFRKWEGRGIGMATLVNLCLENVTDVPFYRLKTEDVRLHVCAGRLLDERMERHFDAFGGFIASRLGGGVLTDEQKRVLSYLIKSEWLNKRHFHTILLTPDNNHFAALARLEEAELISKHGLSDSKYPVYFAHPTLVRLDYSAELRQLFGGTFNGLKELQQKVLGVVYRYSNYGGPLNVNAKRASYAIWYEDGATGTVEEFDRLYRAVRLAFKQLLKLGYLVKMSNAGKFNYRLNGDYNRAF
jgi:ATP-dependent DNA helicase RecG